MDIKGKSSKSIHTTSRGNKPTLLCNTHSLNWSGVPIGQSHQQKLVLRNSSDNQSIHLSLSIAGNCSYFSLLLTYYVYMYKCTHAHTCTHHAHAHTHTHTHTCSTLHSLSLCGIAKRLLNSILVTISQV